MSPAVLGGCKGTDAKPNGGMAGGCMLGDIASGGIIGGIPGGLMSGGIIGGPPKLELLAAGCVLGGSKKFGAPKLLLLAGMLLPGQPVADFALAAALPSLSYARENKKEDAFLTGYTRIHNYLNRGLKAHFCM